MILNLLKVITTHGLTTIRVALCISVCLILLGHFRKVKGLGCVKRPEGEKLFWKYFSLHCVFTGACKVVDLADPTLIYISDFHSPPPEGYFLKTTVEVMLKANVHNFEKKLNEEIRRPVLVNNKWPSVLLRISQINTSEDNKLRIIDIGNFNGEEIHLEIHSARLDVLQKLIIKKIMFADLGIKYDRMARFTYWMFGSNHKREKVQKWNNFTPILPQFPYRLRLELTTSK